MQDFETKDSGARMEFASGMVRDTNAGKMLWHLVASGPMLRRWAALLTRGAVKYDADNWMKASGPEEEKRFKESAFRHFMQWYSGETDEDHAAAVYFNINGAEYVKGRMKMGPGVHYDQTASEAERAARASRILRDTTRPNLGGTLS
jgi:hypothetical protein